VGATEGPIIKLAQIKDGASFRCREAIRLPARCMNRGGFSGAAPSMEARLTFRKWGQHPKHTSESPLVIEQGVLPSAERRW
jgi:hypothetical protein